MKHIHMMITRRKAAGVARMAGVVGLLVCAVVGLTTAGCGGNRDREHGDERNATAGGPRTNRRSGQGDKLTVRGSDTMVILAQKWAEAFQKANAGKTVEVSGGGSGTGIAALMNGTAELANASRSMKDRERARLKERRGAEAYEVRVALDALAVYVQRDNPMESITLAQLKKIFRGQTTNWRDLGGPDRPIVIYSRENNSGTYAYFKEHVLGDEDFSPRAQTLAGTSALINAVSRDPNGIGYGGIGYAEGVRTVPIKTETGVVEPTMEEAVSGRYPLARFLHVYAAGAPEGIAAEYIAFILSEEGQKIVGSAGYFPLPKAEDDNGGNGEEESDAEEDSAAEAAAAQ